MRRSTTVRLSGENLVSATGIYSEQAGTKVTSCAEVDAILRSGDFAQALFQHGAGSYPFVGRTLSSRHGDEHFELRRLEARLLTRQNILHYATLAISEFERVVDTLASEADGLVRADLIPLLRRALVPVAAAIVGFDGVTTPDAVTRVSEYAGLLGEGATVHHSLRDQEEVIAAGLEAKRRLVEEFLALSRYRRQELVERFAAGEVNEDDLPRDLLTILLVSDAFSDEPDEDVLVREAVQYLIAAMNTSAAATPHAFFETRQWLERHPEDGRLVDEDDFMQRAVHEALRLHPPNYALYRVALRTSTVGGRTMEQGTVVMLDIGAASRDTNSFGPDAAEFDPHRVLRGPVRTFGMAFGGGATHVHWARARGRRRCRCVVGWRDRCHPGARQDFDSRGVTLDPSSPPRLRQDTSRGGYAGLPVIVKPRHPA